LFFGIYLELLTKGWFIDKVWLLKKDNYYLESLSKQNNSGENASYIAAENGHLEIVKELIK
jgi:ankyrin repeat protein